MQMIATERLFVPTNPRIDKVTGNVVGYANGIVVKGQEFNYRGKPEDAPSKATCVDPKDQKLVDEAKAKKAAAKLAAVEAKAAARALPRGA
jgi:hypothetical protein